MKVNLVLLLRYLNA